MVVVLVKIIASIKRCFLVLVKPALDRARGDRTFYRVVQKKDVEDIKKVESHLANSVFLGGKIRANSKI